MLASVASIVQSGGLGQAVLRIIHMHVKAAHDVGMATAATGARVRRGAVAKTEAVAGVAAGGGDAAKEDAAAVEEQATGVLGSESDEESDGELGSESDEESVVGEGLNEDEQAWLDSVLPEAEDETPSVFELAAEIQKGGEIMRLVRAAATGGAEAAGGAEATDVGKGALWSEM